MEHISELVRARRSVRTFAPKAVSAEDREKLRTFMEKIDNPYEIPVSFKLLDADGYGLSSPVVSGESLYVGATVQRISHAEEAFGYSFEMLVLYAQSLGIGTVWIGGTMDRAVFERAMDFGAGEMMPCVSPLGYPAKKMSMREAMMRKAIKADSRLAFEELFYDGTFDVPLTEAKAGILAEPLEMVRWAPSAVNKQPWRIIVSENAVHFYLKKTKGFISEAAGNMQKIDMGISLCHFALSAKETGLTARFVIDDPGIASPSDTEYIASYLIS